MNKSTLYRSIIVILLIFIFGYFFFFSLPALLNIHIIGFEGKFEHTIFKVTRVLQGSPAASAELDVGDVIAEQGGITTDEWYGMFSHDLSSYLSKRYEWRFSPVDHLVVRNNDTLHISIQPRRLSYGELLWLYFIRFTLSAIVAGLALFIVFSNSESSDGFICSLSFSFLALWLLSGVRYWNDFFLPYIPDVNPFTFLIISPVFILASSLIVSGSLHFAALFPVEREFFTRHRWIIIPVIYITGPLLIGISILLAHGSFSERYSATYNFRLLVFSSYLALALIRLLINHLTCKSPLQKERSKWVVISVAIVFCSYLFFWNIPKLISGRPLVPNFDWLLLPLLLVPLAMTISIDRHHLFGIQGLINRRIKILEEQLTKEKESASSRDQKIQELSEEIKQLSSELKHYAMVEFPGVKPGGAGDEAMEKLEQRHPGIKIIRQERLIGRSPLWKQIFEEILLASQGDAPVLIEGESGTGKTDVAWAICFLGERRERAFKAISCAQFEHSDPAFALGKIFGIGKGHGLPNVSKEGQKGLLEECDGGTLFLDDFDRLPLNVQDLLLYPLEGKPFEPGIGSGPAKKVSVKFIFATNQDLERLASEGKFRSDVLARIVSKVYVPALRERPEDVPLLVEHFASMAARELKHEISIISPKAMNLFLDYSYAAGNARELQSEIYKAIGKAMLEGDHILRAVYLSDRFRASRTQLSSQADSGLTSIDESREIGILRKHQFRIWPSEKELGYSHKSRTLSNHLRGICIKALSENDWDIERTARKLAGEEDPKLIDKIKSKLIRFFKNVEENVRKGTEQKLFNNLPAHYHPAFHAAIAYVRSRASSDLT